MLFYYKREIPSASKEGNPVPVYVQDCFNIDCVVRGVWADPETFVVLLNDGHEATQIVQPKRHNKEGKVIQEEVKQRNYVISEILIDREDYNRLRELTDPFYEYQDPKTGSVPHTNEPLMAETLISHTD